MMVCKLLKKLSYFLLLVFDCELPPFLSDAFDELMIKHDCLNLLLHVPARAHDYCLIFTQPFFFILIFFFVFFFYTPRCIAKVWMKYTCNKNVRFLGFLLLNYIWSFPSFMKIDHGLDSNCENQGITDRRKNVWIYFC